MAGKVVGDTIKTPATKSGDYWEQLGRRRDPAVTGYKSRLSNAEALPSTEKKNPPFALTGRALEQGDDKLAKRNLD